MEKAFVISTVGNIPSTYFPSPNQSLQKNIINTRPYFEVELYQSAKYTEIPTLTWFRWRQTIHKYTINKLYSMSDGVKCYRKKTQDKGRGYSFK